MKDKLYIIGGGIAGCAFAYFLKKDFDITLYEKSPELGGLIRTRYNLENIPWQQVPSILHTDQDWIVDLIQKFIPLKPVEYKVAMDPLFDFRYYLYPFNKSTIDTMPWHWKEAILLDLEHSNGENAETLEQVIVNFYGQTIYDIFYKNYLEKIFHTDKINIVDWYKPWLRNVHEDFNYYINKYVMFPIDAGWNNLFSGLTDGINIKLGCKITELPKDGIVIFTGDVGDFFNVKKIYSYGSFDIDSTIYKENAPDTLIYPNYTPFTYMTQYGRFFIHDKYNEKFEKNIIVKTFIDDGDIPLFPIPNKANEHIYNKVVKDNPGVIFAGRSGSWSFMDIDTIFDQAQKISATIKHLRRNK